MEPTTDQLETFTEHHHCPRPEPDGEVNMWGGLECKSCGFEVVVASWFSGVKK